MYGRSLGYLGFGRVGGGSPRCCCLSWSAWFRHGGCQRCRPTRSSRLPSRSASTSTAKPQTTIQGGRCRCRMMVPRSQSAPLETTATVTRRGMCGYMRSRTVGGCRSAPISMVKPPTTPQGCRCRCRVMVPRSQSALPSTAATVSGRGMCGFSRAPQMMTVGGCRLAPILMVKPASTGRGGRCRCRVMVPRSQSAPS